MWCLPQPFSLMIPYLSTRFGVISKVSEGPFQSPFQSINSWSLFLKKNILRKCDENGFFIRQNWSPLRNSENSISQPTNQLRGGVFFPWSSTIKGTNPRLSDQWYHGQPSSFSMKFFMGLYILLPFARIYISSNKTRPFYPMVEPDFYSSSTNFPFGDQTKIHLSYLRATYI